MSFSAPYVLVAAFTSNAFGGNPAAIVLLNNAKTPEDIQIGVAKNFNQPMTVFVKPIDPPARGQTVVTTDIRFVTANGVEVGLCGHGTLAAAKAVLSQPPLSGSEVNTITFRTTQRGIVEARKLAEDLYEVEFPAGSSAPISAELHARLVPVINRAFGREVAIKHIAVGGGSESLTIIELDEKENLGESTVDSEAFRASGYIMNVVTTDASTQGTDEEFVSRMFSPAMIPGGEDPVCGFAHCVLAPYWYRKKGIAPGREIVARQVSPRGGVLRIVWDEEKGTVKVRGDATIFATGSLLL